MSTLKNLGTFSLSGPLLLKSPGQSQPSFRNFVELGLTQSRHQRQPSNQHSEDAIQAQIARILSLCDYDITDYLPTQQDRLQHQSSQATASTQTQVLVAESPKATQRFSLNLQQTQVSSVSSHRGPQRLTPTIIVDSISSPVAP